MERQRYKTMGTDGETNICKEDRGRYLSVRDLAQSIALDIVDDYNDIVAGKKKLAETNMELSIKVLNAISKAM